jgi:calcineurin-like phosphoesterase family protein
VHNGGNDPAYQEKFNVLGKKAVNVGVDVQNFFPVSIKNILEITGTEA